MARKRRKLIIQDHPMLVQPAEILLTLDANTNTGTKTETHRHTERVREGGREGGREKGREGGIAFDTDRVKQTVAQREREREKEREECEREREQERRRRAGHVDPDTRKSQIHSDMMAQSGERARQ
jgi:hypothetical protein